MILRRQERLRTEEQTVGLARHFGEIPTLTEGFRAIVNAVRNHSNECKRLPCFIAITPSLCQQQIAQLLTMAGPAHAQPCENSDR